MKKTAIIINSVAIVCCLIAEFMALHNGNTKRAAIMATLGILNVILLHLNTKTDKQ